MAQLGRRGRAGPTGVVVVVAFATRSSTPTLGCLSRCWQNNQQRLQEFDCVNSRSLGPVAFLQTSLSPEQIQGLLWYQFCYHCSYGTKTVRIGLPTILTIKSPPCLHNITSSNTKDPFGHHDWSLLEDPFPLFICLTLFETFFKLMAHIQLSVCQKNTISFRPQISNVPSIPSSDSNCGFSSSQSP